MTAEQIADVFDARRIGDCRWVAKCPSHPDHSPSLSIGTGRDGRVLVNCFAGCAIKAILAAVGLTLRDLFPGPPRTVAEQRKAAEARSGQRRKSRARGRAVGVLSDDVRQWNIAANQIGATLAYTDEDDASGDVLALHYHDALSRLREAERKLACL